MTAWKRVVCPNKAIDDAELHGGILLFSKSTIARSSGARGAAPFCRREMIEDVGGRHCQRRFASQR